MLHISCFPLLPQVELVSRSRFVSFVIWGPTGREGTEKARVTWKTMSTSSIRWAPRTSGYGQTEVAQSQEVLQDGTTTIVEILTRIRVLVSSASPRLWTMSDVSYTDLLTSIRHDDDADAFSFLPLD